MLRWDSGHHGDFYRVASFLGWEGSAALFMISHLDDRDKTFPFCGCRGFVEFQGEVWPGVFVIGWTADWGGGYLLRVVGDRAHDEAPVLDLVLGEINFGGELQVSGGVRGAS